jgi:hypothetical protein
MYAVNLIAMAELTRDIENLPLLLLLRNVVLVRGPTVKTLRGIGHEALLVKDDVTAERWNALVLLIRKKFRYAEFPLYEKKLRGHWRAVR